MLLTAWKHQKRQNYSFLDQQMAQFQSDDFGKHYTEKNICCGRIRLDDSLKEQKIAFVTAYQGFFLKILLKRL